MLTDEEKLELFDHLLRDALKLADALNDQTQKFSELRTAWKNVHAVRALRDDPSRADQNDLPPHGCIAKDGCRIVSDGRFLELIADEYGVCVYNYEGKLHDFTPEQMRWLAKAYEQANAGGGKAET